MNITIKQLNDVISLSVLAVCEKDMDGTEAPVEDPNNLSPVENELSYILPNCDRLDLMAINSHIAAIRLGMRIASQK